MRASGYQTAFLEADTDIEELVLAAGLRATLRRQQRLELQGGERRASLIATVVFPAPGTYRLSFSIHQPAGEGVMMASSAQVI